MRLPNGYGSVYKLGGTRRKPWAVRKTTGWTFEGGKSFPIYHFIGYYATRKEALQALADFNKAPYDLKGGAVKFGALLERWKEAKRPTVSEKRYTDILTSASALNGLLDVPVDRLSYRSMQDAIDATGRPKTIIKEAITILGQVADFGIKQGMAPDNLRDLIRNLENHGTEAKKIERSIFSDDDVDFLWRDESPEASVLLTLLYTGMRSGELFALTNDDVDMDQRMIRIRKGKTAAAAREVPICNRLMPRFTLDPFGLSKSYRGQRMGAYMKEHCSGHLLHDTRHSFISWATAGGMDDRVLKQIVGHKGDGVTMDVYTHIPFQAKLDAVDAVFG